MKYLGNVSGQSSQWSAQLMYDKLMKKQLMQPLFLLDIQKRKKRHTNANPFHSQLCANATLKRRKQKHGPSEPNVYVWYDKYCRSLEVARHLRRNRQLARAVLHW